MISFWRRLPVLIRAPIAGLAVSIAGIYPWSVLAIWNQRVLLKVPWAIVPMTVYLWLYWKYLNGAWWPQSTAEARRTSLRANRLTADVWSLSLVAGLIGLAALLALLRIMNRLVRMPAESQPIHVPPQMPFATVFLLLLMASIVAGVAEEAAFRGYIQGPIERRHGLLLALLVNGALFGLGHYAHHPQSVLAMIPYYLAVSTVYGGLAHATNSILPGLVLHAGGDVFSLTRLWMTGQAEWQMSPSAAALPPLIWETGVDAAFIRPVIVFIVLSSVALWAYFQLARTARKSPATK